MLMQHKITYYLAISYTYESLGFSLITYYYTANTAYTLFLL